MPQTGAPPTLGGYCSALACTLTAVGEYQHQALLVLQHRQYQHQHQHQHQLQQQRRSHPRPSLQPWCHRARRCAPLSICAAPIVELVVLRQQPVSAAQGVGWGGGCGGDKRSEKSKAKPATKARHQTRGLNPHSCTIPLHTNCTYQDQTRQHGDLGLEAWL
jgi:hypothetical protein